MNRNTLYSFLTGIVATLAVMLAAGATTAYAQSPNCCDYIVNTEAVPASCFPLTIVTHWGAGNDVKVITAPGFKTFPIPFACPPAPPFVAATVTSSAACCLTVRWYYCGGCLFIEIVRC